MPSTWRSTRWRPRCAARPTGAGSTRTSDRVADLLDDPALQDGVLVTFGSESTDAERQVGPITVTGEGPLVVREKTHRATLMTLDQALYEMELVGHDFYLYVDKDTERPCVVYRRRGYDYGVISLDLRD